MADDAAGYVELENIAALRFAETDRSRIIVIALSNDRVLPDATGHTDNRPSQREGVHECLEAERIKYAIRLPANQVVQNRIGYLLKRPVGRPPNEVRRYYANFTYRAASWSKLRRVIAKVEWHPGELVPRVGFIVTNMSRPAERVVAFYNKRGTCEQWIKEGKGAIKWTRLSRRTFAANAVRLQLRALADRREGREPRPLRRLPDGRGRHSPAKCSRRYCGRSQNYYRSRHPRQRETTNGHAFKATDGRSASDASENGQIKLSTAGRSVTVKAVVRAASLSCHNEGKAPKFTRNRGHLGNLGRGDACTGAVPWTRKKRV